MRKILLFIFSFILLAALSHTAMGQAFTATPHSGISWGRYYITGSLSIDQQNNSKEDSTAYAPIGASIRIGKPGLNRGTIINTPASHTSILSPVMGMLAFDTTAKYFYGYNGTTWKRLDSISGSSLDTAAIYYQLGIRAKYADTGAMLAPYLRKGDSSIYLTPSDAAGAYQPIGSYLTTETDPIFSASDAFPITTTNITNWTAAYNDKINSAAFSGTTTKTFTATQQDAGTVTATFTDFGADTAIWATQSDIVGFSTQQALEDSAAAIRGDFPDVSIYEEKNNKATDFSSLSNIRYPSTQAVFNLLADSCADIRADLASGSGQPLDADLTAIAGLSPSDNDIIQRKSGTWTNRTIAQYKADLAIAWGDISGTPTTIAGYGITNGALNGLVTGSGITMATARLLGRTGLSTGAIEQISVGSTLTLASTSLGLNLSSSNSWIAGQSFRPTSAVVAGTDFSTAGATLTNTATATSGAPNQFSSSLLFLMTGWNGASANSLSWIVQGKTVAGSPVRTYLGFSHFLLPSTYTYDIFNIHSGGSVTMGTTTPDASAIMTLSSTTKGVLPPRMTTIEKNAISSPTEGLIVYDLTLHKLYVWDGSVWQAAW